MALRLTVLTLALLASSAVSAADVRYVSDHLIVSVRDRQGNASNVLEYVPTGTRLELVQRDGDYTEVRTPKGNQGWVRDNYLQEEPVAKDRLADAERQIERLKAERQALQQRIAKLAGERKALAEENRKLTGGSKELEAELNRLRTVAARPLELSNENRDLQARLSELTDEANQLRGSNATLQDRYYRDWFLAGAGVLLAGLLLGVLLPRLRRRSSGWGETIL